jgi:hypothetical protein
MPGDRREINTAVQNTTWVHHNHITCPPWLARAAEQYGTRRAAYPGHRETAPARTMAAPRRTRPGGRSGCATAVAPEP